MSVMVNDNVPASTPDKNIFPESTPDQNTEKPQTSSNEGCGDYKSFWSKGGRGGWKGRGRGGGCGPGGAGRGFMGMMRNFMEKMGGEE